jgi:uncharacterized membrane protein
MELILTDAVPVVRAVIGTALVFFIPGFAWTLAICPDKEMKIIERIVISAGLSLALVTTSIILLNITAGIAVNMSNSLMVIFILTAVPLAIYFFRRRLKKVTATKPTAE